jgi:RNA polymerase sigma-70 factor (ECF subfamily)
MRNAARRLELEGTTRDEPAEFEIPDHVELARLRAALATLPSEQRKALDLAFFRNRTHVQIAQELNVPLGTIKSRLSLAIRKLHASLSPEALH